MSPERKQAPARELSWDGPLQAIGHNRHGWRFAVGSMNGRWMGVALGRIRPGTSTYCHFFAEISEGYVMGVRDRELAIRMTGALAQDPEQCFGGIDVWYIPRELRGRYQDLPRCRQCGRVCCDGDHDDDWDDVL